MIIDFKTGDEIELEINPDAPGEIEKPGECSHYWGLIVSETRRDVTCKACKAIVDPVTALIRLIRHYETRIDNRLNEIRAFDERERIKRERRIANRENRREALVKRRQETLERAAYNEYQAKLLAIRADKQRKAVAKIDAELA